MTRRSRTLSAKKPRRKLPDLAAAILLILMGATAAWLILRPSHVTSGGLDAAVDRWLNGRGIRAERVIREGSLSIYNAYVPKARVPALTATLKQEIGPGVSLRLDAPTEAGAGGVQIVTLEKGKEKVMLYFLASAEKPAAPVRKKARDSRKPAAPPPVALCIDDMGYSPQALEWFEKNRFVLNAAVLPGLPLTEETARRLHEAGVEVLCHLPMQPADYPAHDPGPGAILLGTAESALKAQVREDFDAIPFIAGFNNHMGSALTADRLYMRWVFDVAKEKGLFFLDSRTTTATVAEDVGRGMGLKVLRRHVFLDDIAQADYIRRKLDETYDLALSQGFAVAIAHPHPDTLKALAAQLPVFSRRVKLVKLSELTAQ